jgi:hypothetical protein
MNPRVWIPFFETSLRHLLLSGFPVHSHVKILDLVTSEETSGYTTISPLRFDHMDMNAD